MRYIASVHAYDALDSVSTTVLVKEFPDDPDLPPSTVFVCTTTVPGTGESDPRLWVQDALVAMLEAL